MSQVLSLAPVLFFLSSPAGQSKGQGALGKVEERQDFCMTKHVNHQGPFLSFSTFFFFECSFEECPNIENFSPKGILSKKFMSNLKREGSEKKLKARCNYNFRWLLV